MLIQIFEYSSCLTENAWKEQTAKRMITCSSLNRGSLEERKAALSTHHQCLFWREVFAPMLVLLLASKRTLQTLSGAETVKTPVSLVLPSVCSTNSAPHHPHAYAGKNLKIAPFKEYSWSGHRNNTTQALQLSTDAKTSVKNHITSIVCSYCSPAIPHSCSSVDLQQQSLKEASWNHTFLQLSYNRVTCNWLSLVLQTLEPR